MLSNSSWGFLPRSPSAKWNVQTLPGLAPPGRSKKRDFDQQKMNKQVNQNHYGHGQLQFWGFSHRAYGGWFSMILLRSGLAFWVCATWAIPVPCWVSWLLVCWMQLVAPMIPIIILNVFIWSEDAQWLSPSTYKGCYSQGYLNSGVQCLSQTPLLQQAVLQQKDGGPNCRHV